MPLPSAFYEEDDGGFLSTDLTRGPWNQGHQHAGPPAALLAREIERASGIAAGQTTRLAYDILGPVPIAPLQVETRVLRAGRRVEQIEGTLSADGRPCMRLTAWRMRAEDSVEVATPEAPPPPPADGGESRWQFWTDEVAYHRAFEWKWIEGDIDVPGPATVWTRLKAQLVAGEEPSALERLLTMADAASGASSMLNWHEWLFVNVDLTIHLERPAHGEWMAMDARTRMGDAGAGVCTSVLSDGLGRVGVSAQSLLVERR